MDEVTDADLERLRDRIEALIEAQAKQQAEITAVVARELAPIIERLEIQTAQSERLTATIH